MRNFNANGYRRHTGKTVRGLPPVLREKAVKSIGRHQDRHYCPRCGQKRKACVCP